MTSSEQLVPVLEARDLRKSYGHVQALDGATLSVMPGEILALVGDNGAGKSTFVKVVCGAEKADDGEVLCEGTAIGSNSIQAAQEAGIEVVYQDLALAPDLNIAENVFLGRELRRKGVIGRLGATRRRDMTQHTSDVFHSIGLGDFPALNTPVRELSGGQQQAVAVARAIVWAQSLIAMDEPTAALGVRQTAMVYETMTSAVGRGLSVLVISHDIPKMLTVADRVAVMRHGHIIAVLESTRTSLSEVVGIMLGESVEAR